MRQGRYVAFEGGEGSGKSTQAARLAARLDALPTREPGATALGAQLRALLLGPETGALDDRAEALLMMADRAQHLSEVVLPTLAAGRDVVSDRSAWSTLAYQGYGRGLDLGALRAVNRLATRGLEPDVTLFLDLDPKVGLARKRGEDEAISTGLEDLAFHRRVRAGYTAIGAAAPPGAWITYVSFPPKENMGAAVPR